MTWRKHKTHHEETAAVEAALRKAGIAFKSVGHGTGTAWSWLEINLGPLRDYNAWDALVVRVLEIVKPLTGRSGDWDGQISILAQ